MRLKPSVFAAKLDMKPQTLNGFTGSKQSGATLKTIQRVVVAFPRINTHWLITGEGEPLKSADYPTPAAAPFTGTQDGPTSTVQEGGTIHYGEMDCAQALEVCQNRVKELEGMLADKQLIIDLMRRQQ